MTILRKIGTVLLLCCAVSASVAQMVRLPPGSYNLSFLTATNPYAPLLNFNSSLTNTGEGPGFPVKVQRWPLIPMATFQAFYAHLIARGEMDQLSTFFQALGDNIRLYAQYAEINCSIQDNSTQVVDAANLALAQGGRWVIHSASASARPAGIDKLSSFYAWMPGNFYIGPSARGDLPSLDHLDRRSAYITGQSYLNMLSDLDTRMRDYTSQSISALLPAIDQSLAAVAGRLSSFPLVATQWLNGNNGLEINTINPPREPPPPTPPDFPINERSCSKWVPTLDLIRAQFVFMMFRGH